MPGIMSEGSASSPTPGVQDRGEADFHTEPLRIRGDRQQRLGARLE